MDELKLTVANVDNGILEIRTGEAAPNFIPDKVRIEGDIRSVSSFFNHRTKRAEPAALQTIDASRAVITVNRGANSITGELDPNDPKGTIVSGKLELSDELKKFGINSKSFTQAEMVKLIRFNRLAFGSEEKHAEILRLYQKFSFKTNAEGASEKDQRGNKSNSFSKEVFTDLPNEFLLYIPIYKGEEKRTFRVEICFDASDASVKFWFESVELEELIEIEKELIFKRELEHLNDHVIIYK